MFRFRIKGAKYSNIWQTGGEFWDKSWHWSCSSNPQCTGCLQNNTWVVFMIIYLHLMCKPIWFNDKRNNFILQFSDGGAPESSQLIMSIKWQPNDRVRSRDFQYILHRVSLGEKYEVLQSIWKQHIDEMEMLEGNIFIVSNKQCTVEFQPSADMCWQSWANSELNQAATYLSLYASVSEGNMCTMAPILWRSEVPMLRM